MLTDCSKNSNQAVAIVDNTTIPLSKFKTRYQDFLNTTHVDDNLRFRHLYLQSLIDEHLIITYAQKSQFFNDPIHIQALNSIKDQLLLNTLYEREVKPSLIISEEELRQLYTWSKSSLHVRHLFARNKKTIDSLHQRLEAGDSWEDLAQFCFKDPILSVNGGDLGFMNLGDLDPAFEQVAYQLKDGEISYPVQTQYGYSIIQVVEREVDPFLIEEEFHQKKKWLTLIVKGYKKRPLVKAYTDRILTSLNLQFREEGLQILLSQLNRLSNNISEIPIYSAGLPCLTIVSKGAIWTVEKAQTELRSLSNYQLSHVIDTDNLMTALSGLAVKHHLLDKANSSNLDQSTKFRDELATLTNNYVVKQVIQDIYNQIDVDREDGLAVVHHKAIIAFRDSLKSLANITIDSTIVKSFILSNQAQS